LVLFANLYIEVAEDVVAQIQEASDVLRIPNWHDGNALSIKVPTTAPS